MPYGFMATIEDLQLHIQALPNLIIKGEFLNERPHRHTFTEFHFVFDGEEEIHFPQRAEKISLNTDQMVMIPPAAYHYTQTGKGKPVTRLCFSFSIDAEKAPRSPLYQAFCKIQAPVVFDNAWFAEQMRRCRQLLEDADGPIDQMREGALLLDVIMEALHILYGESDASGQMNRNKLRQKWIIEEHIWTAYHVSDGLCALAKKLYLSQRQTRKLVQQFYGEDYKTLIVRQRMESAKLMLQSGDVSLEQIAEAVGYRSYSGFHLAFVRSFGITPGEYRKQLNTTGQQDGKE